MAGRRPRTTRAGLLAKIEHLEGDCEALEQKNEELSNAFNGVARQLDAAIEREKHRGDAASEHTAVLSKPDRIILEAMPNGGFVVNATVDDRFAVRGFGAFTTLDQALAWLRTNMARPAEMTTQAQAKAAQLERNAGLGFIT